MSVKDNTGGVVSRGFGAFSRLLTRGFAGWFKSQSFPPPGSGDGVGKKIKKSFIYDVYSSIFKKEEKQFGLDIPIIRELGINYNIINSIEKHIFQEHKVNNMVSRHSKEEYYIHIKKNNKKLMNALNILIDDD